MANALNIKNWCESTISSAGWTLISMRALPDLLLCKRKVTILHIGQHTNFDEDHVKVLNKYLLEVYDIQIPEEISGFGPQAKSRSGFKIDWVDKVTGRIKISYVVKKPKRWFSDLFN